MRKEDIKRQREKIRDTLEAITSLANDLIVEMSQVKPKHGVAQRSLSHGSEYICHINRGLHQSIQTEFYDSCGHEYNITIKIDYNRK